MNDQPNPHWLPVAGGCQCGAVRYRLNAPATDIYHCHCQMCRKVHGALFATFAIAPATALVIDRGADSLTDFQSSPAVLRQFCRRCGCQLFCRVTSAPDMIYFTPATLDDGAHPGHHKSRERHIYVGSKVPWYEIESRLPQHDEA